MTTGPKCHWNPDLGWLTPEHRADCKDDCAGCRPCPKTHCALFGRCANHVDVEAGIVTCPGCVGKVRTDLHRIVDRYIELPEEIEVRGINSEAANLHGPSANVEAFAWRRATRARREDRLLTSLEPDDEHHPVNVLGRWVVALGEDYDEPTDLKITLTRAVDYLDKRLNRVAQDDEQDFELMAREVRRCLRHLEAVLHDQGQGDPANIGCFDCGDGLERQLTDAGFEDHWTCKGCRRRYTYAEYNFALRAALEEKTA